MPSISRVVPAALAFLGLAACAGDSVRTVNYGMPYQPFTARSFLAWAAAAGPVAVEVRDNPFQAPSQAVASALAEAASGSIAGIPVRFTGNAAEAARPEWRVVYDFNARPSTASATICGRASPPERGQAGESVSALVVFCNEANPIIAAGVWSGPVGEPGTPAFRLLAMHSMRDLFPPDSAGADSPAIQFPD